MKPLATEMTARGRGPRPIVTRGVVQCGPWRGPRPIVTCGVVQCGRGVVRGLLSHMAWYSGPVAWSAAYCHTWRGTVGPWRGPRPIVTCGVVQCGPWRGIRPIVTRYA